MNGFYTFVVGWGIILAAFIGSTRYKGTRTITYYILWLSIVLTLVTHSDEFATLLKGSGLTGITSASEGSAQQTSPTITIPTPPGFTI